MSEEKRELGEIRSREYVQAADPWERISRVEALAERLIAESDQLRADLAEAVGLLQRARKRIPSTSLLSDIAELGGAIRAFLARFPEDRP